MMMMQIIFFLSGYSPLPTPTISSPSEPVCDDGGTFYLNNKPSDFSVQWNVTPSYYFNSPVSGNTTSATVYPKSQYIGKECTITFTISHNGTASYSKNFIINGPDEDQVSITVEDAYGGSPPKYGDIYLLCPYSTYYIYYNNYTSCSTWDFDWVLPYGWTEYWSSNNYVSIGTNNYPYGTLEVWAKTCCETQSRVKVRTQLFASGGDCDGYFLFYPNPASGELMIAFDDKLDMSVQDKSLEIYDNNFNLIFKLDNFVKEIMVNTNNNWESRSILPRW